MSKTFDILSSALDEAIENSKAKPSGPSSRLLGLLKTNRLSISH